VSEHHGVVTLEDRAHLHAALGERARLAIVDELLTSDRSPAELGERLGMRSNLLARHLDVLEQVGLITRSSSAGDGRRKYVHLDVARLAVVQRIELAAPERVLFVCTHNTARSPLAAALWRRFTGGEASSAGLRPAPTVHAGARAAARRRGVTLEGVTPRALDEVTDLGPTTQVITVCDSVHEELEPPASWWHWSIPDPLVAGTREAFDHAATLLSRRIAPFHTSSAAGGPST
jgi:ArsR family transcriptional regulator, arsenate/arsenite/antimonite-responsive transcriptional repressor / arsenate reductase (thioredoxin)